MHPTGCSAGYNGTNAVITTSDSVSSFFDTAIITIQNGYDGVALGTTLSDLLAQGTLGNVSFNLVSASNNGTTNNPNYMAYWNVELTNPVNSSDKVIVNAFGDNVLGSNPFNQGQR